MKFTGGDREGDQGILPDLVIGAVTNYRLDQVWPWLASLEQCGFRGEKAMIVYEADFAFVDELIGRGFDVYAFQKDDQARRFRFADSTGEEILVSRFFHTWCVLAERVNKPLRYVIAADVKDVIFQEDPARWLESCLDDKALNVGSESVRFADEPWGREVMAAAFETTITSCMQSATVYNAGTIAGTFAAMRDFALQVYLVAAGRLDNPDQASANILWSLEPFKSITRFNTSEDGWACQAGTSMAPSYVTGRKLTLLEAAPVFDGEVVRTSAGKPFCLVHQYDRVPELREAFTKKYGVPTCNNVPAGPIGEINMRPEWRLKKPR